MDFFPEKPSQFREKAFPDKTEAVELLLNSIDKVKSFAERINAELGASRKMVDNGFMPYSSQVGLTGRTVSPTVFVAVGISGAVHHIVGFDRSGTVIAINSDKSAPIFDYADYGIVCDIENIR